MTLIVNKINGVPVIIPPSQQGLMSGGTVTGATIFIAGLSANSISATTYLGLPPDVYVNSGVFSPSSSTIIFTNTTGGTFNVTGITVSSTGGGGAFTGGTVTGFTEFINGLSADSFTLADPINLSGYTNPLIILTAGTNPNNVVTRKLFDGRVYIRSSTNTSMVGFDGITNKNLYRINSNGSGDTTFNPVYVVPDSLISANGKLYLNYNDGTPTREIRSMNLDGSINVGFTTPLFSDTVTRGLVDFGGGIFVTGFFTSPSGRIACLNYDGSINGTFDVSGGGLATIPSRIFYQAADSTLWIFNQNSGQIINFNGAPSDNGSVLKLDLNGTPITLNIVTGFNTISADGFNNGIVTASDDSTGIIVVGGFTTYDGVPANRIAKLFQDGTKDEAFNTNVGSGFNATPFNIYVRSDGRYFITGPFTTYNGVPSSRAIILNANGTVYQYFNTFNNDYNFIVGNNDDIYAFYRTTTYTTPFGLFKYDANLDIISKYSTLIYTGSTLLYQSSLSGYNFYDSYTDEVINRRVIEDRLTNNYNFTGNTFLGNSLVKIGGTSDQYLLADGTTTTGVTDTDTIDYLTMVSFRSLYNF